MRSTFEITAELVQDGRVVGHDYVDTPPDGLVAKVHEHMYKTSERITAGKLWFIVSA